MIPRTEQKSRLTRDTVVSVEREFALFDQRARPLSRGETARVMDRLRSELASFHRTTEVVEEVAPNAAEVKLCLSNVGSVLEEVRSIYRVIADVISQSGVLICGSSQPATAGLTEDATHFMTVDVFKATLGPLAATNSIHLHFGASDEEQALAFYAAGNRIAPILLAASQCAVIDGQERGRAALLRTFIETLPSDLATPWPIEDVSSYFSRLESVRSGVDSLVGTFSSAYRGVLSERYPTFVNGDGRVIRWSPDKVFHQMRFRPDKSLPEKNLVASVEFRPLDGQPTLQRDLAVLQLTLGLMAFEVLHNPTPLSPTEAVALAESTKRVSEFGFGAIMWNGLADSQTARIRAIRQLTELGLGHSELLDFSMDAGASEYRAMRLLPQDLVQQNHSRFMQSVASA